MTEHFATYAGIGNVLVNNPALSKYHVCYANKSIGQHLIQGFTEYAS